MPPIRPKPQPIAEKVAYVKQQGQTRDHHCHWPGCGKAVPPAMWGCKAHWFKLPKRLRDRIWATFRPGQETNWTPSNEYLAAAHEVQQWIAEHYPTVCRACGGTKRNSRGGVCVACEINDFMRLRLPQKPKEKK